MMLLDLWTNDVDPDVDNIDAGWLVNQLNVADFSSSGCFSIFFWSQRSIISDFDNKESFQTTFDYFSENIYINIFTKHNL